MRTLPGTLWINRGRWNWRVKLPGESKRKNIPLRLPHQKEALLESKGRDLAESIAWRMWAKIDKQAIQQSSGTLTLAETSARFLRWAETYYRRTDGAQTGEAGNCEVAMRYLVGPYGDRSIDDISYSDIIAARDVLLSKGFTRGVINQRVGIWKRFFSWALENRICAASTKSEVWAISGIKQGRSLAPEQKQVNPVPHWAVKLTLKNAPPSVAAMASLQELTGMRPGEVCRMKGECLSTWRGMLVYRPETHKTQHKGKPRVIVMGPIAQRILQPYKKEHGLIFSPRMAIAERGLKGSNPRGYWSVTSYAQAIKYAIAACRKSGHAIPDWSPNQLRHSCGTRVRRKFGLSSARVVLGHSGGQSAITDRYTKNSIEREIVVSASFVMRAIG